jgi:hypothetical protein
MNRLVVATYLAWLIVAAMLTLKIHAHRRPGFKVTADA